MKTRLLKTSLATGLLVLGVSQANAVIELDVTAVLSPTVGTTTPVTNVSPSIGQTASYELNLFDTVAMTSTTAYLQVELLGFSGLTSHRISVGQGNPDRVGIAILGDSAGRDATYEFTFYSDIAFSNILVVDSFSMQISDIDSAERVTVSTTDFVNVGLSAGTQLTNTTGSGQFLVQNTVGENIPKDAPTAAANFTSVPNISTFQVTLFGSGAGGREFQFDFTPDIAGVPEPSTAVLLAGVFALATSLVQRRRA